MTGWPTRYRVDVSDDRRLAIVHDGRGEEVIIVCSGSRAKLSRRAYLLLTGWQPYKLDGHRWYRCWAPILWLRIWLITERNRGAELEESTPGLWDWWQDGVRDFSTSDLAAWIAEAERSETRE